MVRVQYSSLQVLFDTRDGPFRDNFQLPVYGHFIRPLIIEA
jgi:hypothetical protein